MNDRWKQNLETAVEAYDTPLPWERGTQRQAFLARRKLKIDQIRKLRADERRHP